MTTDSFHDTRVASHTGRLRRWLGRALHALFAGWVLVGCVGIWLNLSERSLLRRFQTNPFSVTLAEARGHDHRVDVLNGVGRTLFVATGVVFVAWLFLEHRRVERLGVRTTFKSGWAIGGWIIPFANLYIPYRVTADIWSGTAAHVASQRDARTTGDAGSRLNLVPIWWGAVLVNGFVVMQTGNAANEVHNVTTALRANAWYFARDGAFIVAAALSLLIVRAISSSRDEGRPLVAEAPSKEFWGRPRRPETVEPIQLDQGDQ